MTIFPQDQQAKSTESLESRAAARRAEVNLDKWAGMSESEKDARQKALRDQSKLDYFNMFGDLSSRDPEKKPTDQPQSKPPVGEHLDFREKSEIKPPAKEASVVQKISGLNLLKPKAERQSENQHYARMLESAFRAIKTKHPFFFPSIEKGLDGKNLLQHGVMNKITDHNQLVNNEYNAGATEEKNYHNILERVQNGQSDPQNVTINLHIDLSAGKNLQHVKNLDLEIPLTTLQSGHLTEILGRFYFLVLAADQRYRDQKNVALLAAKQQENQRTDTGKRLLSAQQAAQEKDLQQPGLLAIGAGDMPQQAIPAFAQGDNKLAAFRINNGEVWGVIDLVAANGGMGAGAVQEAQKIENLPKND